MAGRCLVVVCAALCIVGASAQQTTAPEATYNFTVGFNPATLSTTFINYTDGSTPLRGFLAYKNTTSAARPGVLIVPDWDGIGPYEQWRAKQLAELGYVAFVADIFGADVQQGPFLPTANRSALTGYFGRNIDVFRERMSVGLDQLRNVSATSKNQLAAIGYCFGGAGVLELMRSWPNRVDGLRGVMPFHGVPITARGSNATLGNPIRIVQALGANDNGFSLPALGTFIAEMTAANVTWELDLYGQTAHAFTEPFLVGAAASSGSAYNEVADERSWLSLRGFLMDLFGAANAANPYTAPVMEPALASV
ncbi:hypothetical protein WJX72_003155 [[Myrmecia] bisecta]|uniref:Dienelactone hydrolase domain-containing protein n=1 Tax=[Myrmecia] bisecta TaxID=41462 RepID=A0AAW1QPR4_9CHLO